MGEGRRRAKGRARRVTFAFVVAVMAMAMTSGGCTSGGGPSTDGAAPVRSSRDVLMAADMEAWGGEDLLTVIRRSRSHWLQARKMVTSSIQPISVVVDGVVQPGGVDVLRGYRAGFVEEARFVNARDATTQFGLSMMSGAIVVKLKR